MAKAAAAEEAAAAREQAAVAGSHEDRGWHEERTTAWPLLGVDRAACRSSNPIHQLLPARHTAHLRARGHRMGTTEPVMEGAVGNAMAETAEGVAVSGRAQPRGLFDAATLDEERRYEDDEETVSRPNRDLKPQPPTLSLTR